MENKIKLSYILRRMDELEVEYDNIYLNMEESEEKDILLENISLNMDCLDVCLMYGDYINDTGKEYDYWK